MTDAAYPLSVPPPPPQQSFEIFSYVILLCATVQ